MRLVCLFLMASFFLAMSIAFFFSMAALFTGTFFSSLYFALLMVKDAVLGPLAWGGWGSRCCSCSSLWRWRRDQCELEHRLEDEEDVEDLRLWNIFLILSIYASNLESEVVLVVSFGFTQLGMQVGGEVVNQLMPR